MTRNASRRRGERGVTILEVMIAFVTLLVAMTGFVGMGNYAATATAVAHRRTAATFLRAGLMDRLAVTPRTSLAAIPANTWVIDSCYDQDSQPLPGGSNSSYASAFQCPAGAAYRGWVSSAANGATGWRVSLYVERIIDGCTAAERYRSIGCSAADLLLTD